MIKKFSFVFCAIVALILSSTTANALKFDRQSVMAYKSKLTEANVPAAVPAKLAAANDGTVSKAYGIRLYSELSIIPQLVSFNVDNPGEMTVEMDLPFHTSRAAAGNGNLYYILDSSDGMTTDNFYCLDLHTKVLTTIATYDLFSLEKGLIIQDMTYDETTDRLYALAFNIDDIDVSGEDINLVKMGLYTFDITTGTAEEVGTQDTHALLSIAASPQGELIALDSEGSLWAIDKTTGKPGDTMGYTLRIPSGLQSMDYNHSDGLLYWAGFSFNGEVGSGYFGMFAEEEGRLMYNFIGKNQDNSEVIGLHIDNKPLSKSSPAAVSELTVVPDANGASEAVISWLNPTTLYGGSALTGTFNVNIYRNDVKVGTVENCTAGSKASYTDSGANGLVRYNVMAENASGEGPAVYSDEVFVGYDVPGKVGNLTIAKAADSYDIMIAWSAPTIGKYEGWFDESTLKYDIVRYPDGKKVAEGLTETSFLDTNITETQGYYYDVTAVNANGKGATTTSATQISGPALQVPYFCDFKTDEQVHLWTIHDEDHDGQTWRNGVNYAGTTDAFMEYFPDYELGPDVAGNDWIISAPIALKAGVEYRMRYSLRIMYYSFFPLSYKIAYGEGMSVADMTNVMVDNVKSENRQSQVFEDYVVPFSVAKDGEYSFGIGVFNAVLAQFTNIAIEELEPIELGVSNVKGMPAVIAGKSSTYTVKVYNNGGETVSDYTVKLCDGSGAELASQVVTEDLAPQEKKDIAIEWVPTTEGNMKLTAQVVTDGDADPSNNKCNDQLKVTVISEGEWYNVTDGVHETTLAPFCLNDPHSATQTIYTKEMVNAETGLIEGIMYYYSLFNNQAVNAFNAKIYLANTTETDFDKEAPTAIPQDEFTLVFNGSIQLETNHSAVFISFEKPFEYTGENICVFATHESEGGSIVECWKTNYNGEDPACHSWLYSGSRPFNFDQKLTAYIDYVNISFYQPLGGVGINGITTDDANAPIQWYNLQGINMTGKSLTPGIYIRRQGSTSTKVVIE